MNQTSHQTGYTLIELLLYVSMVGALLIAVTGFFAVSMEARIKSQSISEVDQQGRAAMELITQTVRNASGITAPVAAATAAQLTVTVPTASLSPTIFNLSGTTLQIKEGAATAVPITSSDVEVSALSFKNLTRTSTTGILQVSFVVSRTNPSGRNEYSYQKTFTSSVARRYP